MSHTRVKTKYSVQGSYGSTDTTTLYCDHNHGTDFTTFYDETGDYQIMLFNDWKSGDDLYDAMQRLWYPFKGEWGKSELKDGVEYYSSEEFNNLKK